MKSDDPKYRAGRAEHYAQIAKDSHIALGKAKTEVEKTKHEASLAHAAQRAGVHAKFVVKNFPGSELADKVTLHAEIANSLYKKFKDDHQTEIDRQIKK